MTCKKHGEVEGRLFQSGSLLCPLCIQEVTDRMTNKILGDQVLREQGFVPFSIPHKEDLD